jgi:hypothetical protein
MQINLNKYKKILKFKKKFNFTDFELITNYGLFSGDVNLYKTLVIYDLIKETDKLKGNIIELGIDKGNTSLLIKKILDIFKIKKKLYLLDHFKGLIHYHDKKDTLRSKLFYGRYITKKQQIVSFIDYFKFKNIKIIDKDATKLLPGFFTGKFCLAYFDMDLYIPTIKALKAIDGNIVKGGYIVFDQGNKKLWSENKAIKDFLNENKKYRYITINRTRQPDVILKKFRN